MQLNSLYQLCWVFTSVVKLTLILQTCAAAARGGVFQYKGCFLDQGSGTLTEAFDLLPEIPAYIQGRPRWSSLWDDNNTPDFCFTRAKQANVKYFAVFEGKACWAVIDVAGATQHGTSDKCDTPCGGDTSLQCGGQHAIELYQITGGSFRQMGCYTNSFAGFMGAPLYEDYESNSIEKCGWTAASRGLRYFSVQNAGRCFGGNDFAIWSRTVMVPLAENYSDIPELSAKCDMVCPGDESSMCGGPSHVSAVYEVLNSNLGSYISKGCYVDGMSRPLPSVVSVQVPTSQFGPKACYDAVMGNRWPRGTPKVFGLSAQLITVRNAYRYTNYVCHAGWDLDLAKSLGETTCSSLCPGNRNASCGGAPAESPTAYELYSITGGTTYKRLGCYKDGYIHSLPRLLYSDAAGEHSVQQCGFAAKAAGVKYFGLYNEEDCRGGDSWEDAVSQGIALGTYADGKFHSACSSKCPGNEDDSCGGEYLTKQVFSLWEVNDQQVVSAASYNECPVCPAISPCPEQSPCPPCAFSQLPSPSIHKSPTTAPAPSPTMPGASSPKPPPSAPAPAPGPSLSPSPAPISPTPVPGPAPVPAPSSPTTSASPKPSPTVAPVPSPPSSLTAEGSPGPSLSPSPAPISPSPVPGPAPVPAPSSPTM